MGHHINSSQNCKNSNIVTLYPSYSEKLVTYHVATTIRQYKPCPDNKVTCCPHFVNISGNCIGMYSCSNHVRATKCCAVHISSISAKTAFVCILVQTISGQQSRVLLHFRNANGKCIGMYRYSNHVRTTKSSVVYIF